MRKIGNLIKALIKSLSFHFLSKLSKLSNLISMKFKNLDLNKSKVEHFNRIRIYSTHPIDLSVGYLVSRSVGWEPIYHQVEN